jgi:hypothetical protein
MKILSFLIVFGAIASACERKTSSNPSENSTFSQGFYVVALPMKIGKGSGAPLRLAAFIKS